MEKKTYQAQDETTSDDATNVVYLAGTGGYETPRSCPETEVERGSSQMVEQEIGRNLCQNVSNE